MAALVPVIGSASHPNARGQDHTEFGRIEGLVTDPGDAVLPGVRVTLMGGGPARREAVSDDNGRFIFDDVAPGPAYVVRAELPGFIPDEETAITVVAGGTRSVELGLSVSCFGDLVGEGKPLYLDDLFSADAVVHIRAGDAGEDRHDGCGPRREVAVLGAVRFSDAARRIGNTFQLMWGTRFERGKEYLLFLEADGPRRHPRNFAMSFQREIVGGRLSGEGATELGIRPAMLIEDALTRLRELRRRYSRYRHYDRTSLSTAGLESLRYKTGWILAGVMSDDSWEPSFEFAEGTLPSRTLPRSGARIRMTRDESVFILGFGARGEQLRKRRPALHSMHVFDDTSTHAKSGLVYTVADVRVEWVPDEGARYVWLRLVAP